MLPNTRVASVRKRAAALFSSRATQLLSAALTAAILAVSIALVTYTSETVEWIRYYRQHGSDTVIFSGQNWTGSFPYRVNATWQNAVHYNAAKLNMADTYALLIAGVWGILSALILLAIPFFLDQRRILIRWDLHGRVNRSLSLTRSRLVILLDALLTILFLAICAAVSVRYAQSPYPYAISNLPEHHINRTSSVGPSARITFERWNCALSWNMASHGSSPSRNEVDDQCSKATTSRQLIVPLAVLAFVRLSLRPMVTACEWLWQPIGEFLEWKKHTQEMRDGKTSELDRGKDGRRSDEEAVRPARDSVQEDHTPKDFIVELPAWRMSRVEMSEDAAVLEMPGAEGGKEMDAGVHAAEKDANSRS